MSYLVNHIKSTFCLLGSTYRGCHKNVPIEDRFYVTNPSAAILFSEHYYDKRYNLNLRGTTEDEVITTFRQRSIIEGFFRQS